MYVVCRNPLYQNHRTLWDAFTSFMQMAYHISLVIRQGFFPSKNNPKNLDPSYKMDLDLRDCLRTCIITKFHRTDQVICRHSREEKTLSYSRINMVILWHNKNWAGACVCTLSIGTDRSEETVQTLLRSSLTRVYSAVLSSSFAYSTALQN